MTQSKPQIQVRDLDDEPNLKLPEAIGIDRSKQVTGIPPGFAVPANFAPPSGAQIQFVRFRAEWCGNKAKGDRFAICWPLTIHDERNALSRARGDMLRSLDELAKQFAHVIDGQYVDWTGKDLTANLDIWWSEIGPKCRNIMHRLYTQTHNLTDKETADFFENCVVVMTAG